MDTNNSPNFDLIDFYGHSENVNSVAWSPCGKKFASGSNDETIRIWDIESNSCMAILKGHRNSVRSVAFSPDSKLIVSGSFERYVMVWDVNTKKCIAILEGHTKGVNSVAFSPDGLRIVSGSDDTNVMLWDNTMKLSDNYNRNSISGQNDTKIKLWNIDNNNNKYGNCVAILEGHTEGVNSVAFSPNGIYIVSGSSDKSVKVWSAKNGECIKTLKGHTSIVQSVSVSPDNILIVSGSYDKSIIVWETMTKSTDLIRQLKNSDIVLSLSFSSESRHIVSSLNNNYVNVWDADNGKLLLDMNMKSENVSSVSWKPCGKGNQKILLGCENLVKIWTLPKLQNGGKRNKIKNKITTKKDKSNKLKKLIDTFKKSELVKIAKMHSVSLKTRNDKVKTKLQLFNSLRRKKLIGFTEKIL